MSSSRRRPIQTTCSLFCFRDCDRRSQRAGSQTHSEQHRPDKISLKKLTEKQQVNQSVPRIERIQRSISYKHLEQWKCQSNRSREQQKQTALFRKKAKIEHEIEEVNKQMSRLTIEFGEKINQLQKIKDELMELQDH